MEGDRQFRRVLSTPMNGAGPGMGLELDANGRPIGRLSRTLATPSGLAARVERLRAENARLKAETDRVNKSAAQLRQTLTRARGEAAAVRARVAAVERQAVPLEVPAVITDATGTYADPMAVGTPKKAPKAPPRIVIRGGYIYAEND